MSARDHDSASCRTVRALLAGDREDDLSLEESRAVEAHLETCAACRAALGQAEEDLSLLVARIESSPGVEAPVLGPAAWCRVDDAIHAELKRAREQTPVRGFPTLRPALAAEPAPVLDLAAAREVERRRVAGGGGRIGAGARGFPIGLAAAGLLVAFGLFAALGPSPGRGSSAGIGRVKPPEPDDVVMLGEPSFGGRVKGVRVGALIMVIEGLDPSLAPPVDPTPAPTPARPR